MANVSGSNATETLNGTASADTINGLGGSDRLNGLGGVDTISGGDGADIVSGGEGNDILYGHSAADINPSSGNITATQLANVGSGAVFATGAAGDDGFLYVLRKDAGDIVRINTTTGAQSVFLDIPNAQFSSGGERGVLGLAFHPDYEANGRFFVFLTNTAGNIEVREYARSPGDPATAVPTAVATIITIRHPTYANHNGGSMAFGPDGHLYIGTGDGGGGNDPDDNAQNTSVLLGKILRLDVDRDGFPSDATRDYAIPTDNPFAGARPGADEIWAYGLRNPWRFSFDSLTGALYIGDVGQGAREEVNFQPADDHGGRNYGWDYREGTLPGPSPAPNPPITFTSPVFDYGRDVGHSITGGYVYRGPAPGLQGAYFFGDFVTGRLFTLRMVNGVAEDAMERTLQVVGASLQQISSFGTDNSGNLYVVSLTGTIHRLSPGSAAGDGADRIDGGPGNDRLFGGSGNDTLIGGSGTDQMTGGPGNDAFFVDNAGDRVFEAAGQGTDIVYASATFALGAGQYIETLTTALLSGTGIINLAGNEFAQRINGNNGANALSGLAGNDTLVGYGGNDRLNGGSGADQMYGGFGDDVFYVDTTADKIFEAASQGSDIVYSSVSYTLAAGQHVETLATTALAGTGAINLVGNELVQKVVGNNGINGLAGNGGADTLYGYAGNDRLNGGTGADQMYGGLGDDIFYVDSATDKVFEAANQGTDTVLTAVSYALAAGQHVEKIATTLLTGTAAIRLTGNEFGQWISGNNGANIIAGGGGNDALAGYGGNDTLDGGIGNDVLYGGAGNDTLTGGAGIDYFVFNTTLNPSTNADRITDFNVPQDTIRLDNAVMPGLGTTLGTLSATNFWKSAAGAAHDADDRVIYETDTGKLFYDSNGIGAGGSVHFATLAPNLALTNADFQVI